MRHYKNIVKYTNYKAILSVRWRTSTKHVNVKFLHAVLNFEEKLWQCHLLTWAKFQTEIIKLR